MKRIYLLLMLFPIIVFSQGENDNWYFGNKAAVNFSGTTPVVINTSQMANVPYIAEAAGTVSDSNGKLLFYTDGINIWNRDNQVMDNGSGLSGHESTGQLVIVKSLSNPNQYFIFIGGQFAFGNQIRYSIVDMTLGGIDSSGFPLGRVVDNFKNILVTDYNGFGFTAEAITVVSSPNGSMWLLIPNNQNLYAYSINTQGFNNGNPVISPLNFPYSLHSQPFTIKASPKVSGEFNFSNFICISDWGGNSGGSPNYVNKVYSFDDLTGQITNDYVLQINSVRSYTPEFNFDSSILYLGRENLYAVDLLAANASSLLIANLNYTCFGIQRNKYGEIYVSLANSQYLSKILNPNVFGSSISLDLTNIYLGTHISGMNALAGAGLPQLVEKPVNLTIGNCFTDLILNNPETTSVYTHQVSNTIITEDNYTVLQNQDITMTAGQSITLLPNTYIENGSNYLAKIEGCLPVSQKLTSRKRSSQKISLSIDLDKDLSDVVKTIVYPNPVSDILNIKTKEKVQSASIFDMTGRKIEARVMDNAVDVSNLEKGTYIINIQTEKGTTSEKFIKK